MRTIQLEELPIQTAIVEASDPRGVSFDLVVAHSGQRLIHLTHYGPEQMKEETIKKRVQDARSPNLKEEAEEKLAMAKAKLWKEQQPYAHRWHKLSDGRHPLHETLPPEKDIERIALAYCLDWSSECEEALERGERVLVANAVYLPPAHLQTPSFFIQLGEVLANRTPLAKPWRVWVLDNWLPLGMNAHDEGWGYVAEVMNKQFPEQQKSENTWMKAFHAMGLHLDKPSGPASKT